MAIRRPDEAWTTCEVCNKPLDLNSRVWIAAGTLYAHPECAVKHPSLQLIGIASTVDRETRAYVKTRTAHDRRRVDKAIGFMEQEIIRLREYLDDNPPLPEDG